MTMTAKLLKSVLSEYPPSMRLTFVVDKRIAMETTVLEALVSLMQQRHDVYAALLSRDTCVVRERLDGAVRGPQNTRLEIELR